MPRMEEKGSARVFGQQILRIEEERKHALIHLLEPEENPIPASTHIAHVVKPYTNARGK